jgi:hypothetical protein
VAAFELFGFLSDSYFRPVNGDDGIVAFLNRQSGWSVHANNIVIAAVSSSTAEGEPERALSDGDTKSWRSADTADQWICYEFKRLLIGPTHDSLRTTAGTVNPKEWMAEASSDGTS